MIKALSQWWDGVTGRNHASVAVPVMDGTLKPNRRLDEAEVLLELPGLDDVMVLGQQIWVSAGQQLWHVESGQATSCFDAQAPITALAASPDGHVVMAIDGRRIVVLDVSNPAAPVQRRTWAPQASEEMQSINAIHCAPDGAWYLSVGAQGCQVDQWREDLMSQGRSGRLLRVDPDSGVEATLASQLPYAFGVLSRAQDCLVSGSWGHRVMRMDAQGQQHAFTQELPAYPSRMVAASDGGVWLTCFAARTQLVEFVLREHGYRGKMMAEMHPDHWICPALTSGKSFLEPLQGAGVKTMGVLKPWAPPRSYGLVLRLDAQGQVVESLHSLVDGQHHGVTAVAPWKNDLLVVSKGSGRLLLVKGTGGALNG